MSLAPRILEEYPNMNQEQRAIAEHDAGPLLVIAGPGSGKTYSLVLRVMNLLLEEKAIPSEIFICTFTEKAAFELRDRILSAAIKVGYPGDMTSLRVGTIHGLCSRILDEYRHHTDLGSNYETLDELTQYLFIFDNFKEIIGEAVDEKYLGKCSSRSSAIREAVKYFDKITEERLDPHELLTDEDAVVREMGRAYLEYERMLLAKNKTDFAHLQKFVCDLLDDPVVAEKIVEKIKYIMVDEYQDTNYIQEQILLKLAGNRGNICVVGDEDQSLYRFRGATVRNILEFPGNFDKDQCRQVKLTTNYRSHKAIVEKYDSWMASADWTNPDGDIDFRYSKNILAAPGEHPEYPSVVAIAATSKEEEAEQFAEMVISLKEKGIIEDYSQIAVLLYSVKANRSGKYIEALRRRGIPSFCPRARAYFENLEVKLMVGAYARILGYEGEGRGQVESWMEELVGYVDGCLVELDQVCSGQPEMAKKLRGFREQIDGLTEGKSLDMQVSDFFYELLGTEPLASMVKDENAAHNLATFSQLLSVFQTYYHYNVIKFSRRDSLRMNFFNSFLKLLQRKGMNEHEDEEQPFPKGYVQFMTIHQSKGLEFPVVVVGDLDNSHISTQTYIDRSLQKYYHKLPFEPEKRMTEFDRMRLHYVAFSRPEKLLVLTCGSGKPRPHFLPMLKDVPLWSDIRHQLDTLQPVKLKERKPPKRAYSFTGDLKVYETCPRQYQFFRELKFTPSHTSEFFFGLLVHQTIEDIHRIVLDGKLAELNKARISEIFEHVYRFLALNSYRQINETAKERAFQQVMNYFTLNNDDLQNVIQTEVDVSVDKDGYILTGKVDLLMGRDQKLQVLDFKTTTRPDDSAPILKTYERQLCTYAYILEERYKKRAERLMLYWTGEKTKDRAIMEFTYKPELVKLAGQDFDEMIGKIKAKDFAVVTVPESKYCKQCDIRSLCLADGVI